VRRVAGEGLALEIMAAVVEVMMVVPGPADFLSDDFPPPE
jgi:hypothetical protein